MSISPLRSSSSLSYSSTESLGSWASGEKTPSLEGSEVVSTDSLLAPAHCSAAMHGNLLQREAQNSWGSAEVRAQGFAHVVRMCLDDSRIPMALMIMREAEEKQVWKDFSQEREHLHTTIIQKLCLNVKTKVPVESLLAFAEGLHDAFNCLEEEGLWSTHEHMDQIRSAIFANMVGMVALTGNIDKAMQLLKRAEETYLWKECLEKRELLYMLIGQMSFHATRDVSADDIASILSVDFDLALMRLEDANGWGSSEKASRTRSSIFAAAVVMNFLGIDRDVEIPFSWVREGEVKGIWKDFQMVRKQLYSAMSQKLDFKESEFT